MASQTATIATAPLPKRPLQRITTPAGRRPHGFAARRPSEYARSLIEASLDPLVTISPDGKITDVNEATIKVTGVARDKLIGTDFSNYFTEPEKAREGYRQVFAKGFVTDYALTIRRQDGHLTNVLYNASVYKDADGKVLGVFAAARDVTAQKRASEYARSLIEASLDPLVTISPDGTITDVNEATVKVTGVARDKLIGTDFSNYFTEPAKAREGYRQVFAEGFVTDYALTIRRQDGHLTNVLYNASVYKDAGGNVLGVFAAARDVTESERVMRDYAETKNFLDNILQRSIKYSIIGKDLDRRILSWNEGAQRNYGYTAEEILGKNSEILHTPEDIASGAVERLLQTAHSKGMAEGEFERVRKDGSHFAANVVVTRRNDAAGNPIGYLLMSSDISEKRRTEEQLRAASHYARSLIEASLDPLVTISPDGKITDVNEATVDVTGFPRARLIGSDFADYFTDPDAARAGYREAFEKGLVTDFPLVLRHRSGTVMDVVYNASVYRDESGAVVGVFAAARNVTSRRRAEEARARALRSLRMLTIVNQMMMHAEDETYLNEETCKKIVELGLFELAWIGYPVSDAAKTIQPVAIAGADADYVEMAHNSWDENDERSRGPMGMAIRTGTVAISRDIETDPNYAPWRTAAVQRGYRSSAAMPLKVEGTTYGALIVYSGRSDAFDSEEIHLLTELSNDLAFATGALRTKLARNEAEQKALLAAHYARSLLEASLDPLVTISPEGKITDLNEATVKLTGKSREQLIGTDFSNYFTEPEKAREGYQQVFAKGSVTDYPLTLRGWDGSPRDVVYNASVYSDRQGNVLGVFAAARDVTAQKQAESQIAEQRARDIERLTQLEQFQRLTVGRELKMIELKKELAELRNARDLAELGTHSGEPRA